MASTVDTSVKHFFREMTGAPTLNGQAGSAIALLDACLVTGFHLTTATALTVSGGVATLTFSDVHSASLHSVIVVDGVTGALAGLNGEQKVTHVATGELRFATALADGTAAGTITFKMAPAGWLKVFSGTNKAVYQSADPTSTKMYLRVDDTGTTFCRLRGYETMSDVDTGAGPFPTNEQISGGGYMNKSRSASADPVNWVVIADACGMYINVVGSSVYDANVKSGQTRYIGDMQALRPGGDPYAFVLGSPGSGDYAQTEGMCDASPNSGHYLPRAYHGLGSCVKENCRADFGTGLSGQDNSAGDFPSVIDGGLILSPRFVCGNSTAPPRAYFPGLRTVPQRYVGNAISPGYLQSGGTALPGRTLWALGCGSSTYAYPSVSLGISFIDITGPWER